MPEPGEESWLRRARWRICGAAAGLIVVGFLLHTLGAAHIAAYLRQIGAGFLLVLAAYFAALVVFALPLRLLLPPPIRLSLPSLLESRIGAVAVNAATPFLGLGGEPVRLLWLAPEERARGLAALAIDRAAFLAASALFLVAGAIAAVAAAALPRVIQVGLPALGGAAVVAAVAIYLAQRRHGLIRPLARVVGWVAPRRGPRLIERATAIDADIRALHRARPGRFTVAAVVHFIGRAVSVVEVLVVARLLGLPLGFVGGLVFTAVPLVIDLAFSMVPSQIGVHEGASALLASALGLDPAAGVAIAFVQRLRQVVFVSLGFALLALTRGRRSDSRVHDSG